MAEEIDFENHHFLN